MFFTYARLAQDLVGKIGSSGIDVTKKSRKR
jgi:hypothetical protein